MADKVRVTVKEKILVHLFGFSKYSNDFEVPQKVTQDGMARVIGVRRSHIASALKDLRESELVEEKKTRIAGNERRKNAYFLTPQGETEALRIKESVLEKEVRITLKDGSFKDVKISEIGKHLEKKLGLVEILSCITSDGEYKEKQQEKKVEPERTVLCPFCAHINFNFELKEVQINPSETGVLVACMFCGMEFLAKDKMDPGFPGVYEAIPPPQPPAQRALPPTGKPFLVSLGLLFMMGSFVLALLVALSEIPSEFCLLSPIGFILSLVILYTGLKDVRHLEVMSRRLLVLTGTIFATFVALFLSLTLGAEFDLEHAGTMALVFFPAFGIFAFGKPIDSGLRSELSLSLGIFLLLFGVFLSAFSGLLSWSVWYTPFWVIAGAVLLFVSYEVHRLDILLLTRSGCLGAGAFFAIFCIVVLNAWWADMTTYRILGILLWLVFFAILIILRFVSQEIFREALYALKTSLFAGVGLLFALVGVVFGIKGRFMEAGVELFIGIPIMWLGLSDAREFGFSKLALISYIMVAEIILVFALLLT